MLDDKMNEKDLIDISPLKTEISSTAQKIIDTKDLDEAQNLIKLFNLSQAKKNILRVMKLNQLMDNIQDEIIDRFDQHPDEFTNTDLLNYFQTAQSAIDRANKSLNLINDMPAIQINQVNIEGKEENILSRQSREKILDYIQNVLNNVNESKSENVIKIKEEILEEQENKDTNEIIVDEQENYNILREEEDN